MIDLTKFEDLPEDAWVAIFCRAENINATTKLLTDGVIELEEGEKHLSVIKNTNYNLPSSCNT